MLFVHDFTTWFHVGRPAARHNRLVRSFAAIATTAASGTTIRSRRIEAIVGVSTGTRGIEEDNAHVCSDKGLITTDQGGGKSGGQELQNGL